MAKVEEIIVERLIKKIKEEKKLPWEKPFAFASINWVSEYEYVGINRILLSGGEYVTPNQLKAYNEKHKTNYWFEKGTPSEIVIYYGPTYKKLSKKQIEDIEEKGAPKTWEGNIVKKGNDYLVRRFILRYYKVYDINHIQDKEGNKLESKLGKTIEERYTTPEGIVSKYTEATGVGVDEGQRGEAYYSEQSDTVYLPEMQYFNSPEGYYRTLFHELAHSTGIEKRMNRQCFKDYHSNIKERSREELIAEMGSLLLGSEAGFREETDLGKNSDSYILSWLSWMENNPYEVVLGMQQAEKVKKYILAGGIEETYNDKITEVAI